MNNRGQFAGYNPVSRWITGLILLMVVLVAYNFFSPIIETTLPESAENMGVGVTGLEVIDNMSSNFQIGILLLGGAYLFYIFIAGLPGQQEEYPI